MIEYMSARDAAEKWNISQRRVSILCAENRIPNVAMLGNMWIIPCNAQKPFDARRKDKRTDKEAAAHPFVKWAGGKGQLLDTLKKYLPNGLGKTVRKYAEPFVGGGALLFSLIKDYSFDEIYIGDKNAELINAYVVIQEKAEGLIEELRRIQTVYNVLTTEEQQRYYYQQREEFNRTILTKKTGVIKAAKFIFLNRTCFNGLYRVNKSGAFNVPVGKYKNPLICDEDNLQAISNTLKNVTITTGDYREVESFVDKKTFVYFDPPYRPLNVTSGFTSYTAYDFSDEDQKNLSYLFARLDGVGAKLMLSNSDPHNIDEKDDFFDDLYADFEIQRIDATRIINSKADRRGKIKELLIKNY